MITAADIAQMAHALISGGCVAVAIAACATFGASILKALA